MAEAALSYLYHYSRPSEVTAAEPGNQPRIQLAAQVEANSSSRLFARGRLLSPKRTGELLLGLMEVVDARFFIPGAMLAAKLRLADPVVTCSAGRLRFEAFSQCCGAYARVDLLENALAGELLNPGTTNVDFNAPMRAGLARLSDASPAHVTIGADRVELESSRAQVVERKVKLPARWLRGFVEVQAFQARMGQPVFTASGAALRRLLQELRSHKGTAFVAAAGAAIRVHSQRQPGAVAVGGMDRLKVLARAARHAEFVEVFADEATGASSWSVHTPDARFHYVLSPDPSRGFSGEGQVLETLAADGGALGAVRAALRWQARIDPAGIAAETGHAQVQVDRALAACAASGLVGFDLADGAYFHRELPFDLSLIEKHQSRLVNARKLVEGDAVEFDASNQAWVVSGENRYRVWLGGPEPRCTCAWVAKHGVSRGPCKHILSARAVQEGVSA